MKEEILLRRFVEPWLGTLQLKLLDTFSYDEYGVINKVYEVIDGDEECGKGNIGGFVVIRQEQGSSYELGVDFISKIVFDIIKKAKEII